MEYGWGSWDGVFLLILYFLKMKIDIRFLIEQLNRSLMEIFFQFLFLKVYEQKIIIYIFYL